MKITNETDFATAAATLLVANLSEVTHEFVLDVQAHAKMWRLKVLEERYEHGEFMTRCVLYIDRGHTAAKRVFDATVDRIAELQRKRKRNR